MKAQRGSRLITLLFLEPQGKRGVGGQRNAPAVLPLGQTLSIHCIGGWVGPTVSLKWCGNPPPPGIRSPNLCLCGNYGLNVWRQAIRSQSAEKI